MGFWWGFCNVSDRSNPFFALCTGHELHSVKRLVFWGILLHPEEEALLFTVPEEYGANVVEEPYSQQNRNFNLYIAACSGDVEFAKKFYIHWKI